MEVATGRNGILDLAGLKPYTERSDGRGLLYLSGHAATLGVTGTLVWLAQGTSWLVPAMIGHGFVMAFLFAPVHECSHFTAFRTRWLNEAVYWLVCLVYGVTPTVFRHSHLAHHRFTQIRGRDPDMVLPREATVRDYLMYVSGVHFWKRNLLWLVRHAAGRVDPSHTYLPTRGQRPKVFREARVALSVYGAVAVLSLAFQSWAAVVLWVLPRLLGEPFMRWIRIAEHGECDEGPDLTRNTRTTRTFGWLRALFWNMSFHAEHHLYPAVPFHALPRLHAAVGDRLHPVGTGYLAVHREVLGALAARRGATWSAEGRAA
jgi:fatty acid desaturase